MSGNTDLLLLSLLEQRDMYGYQIMEELARRSDQVFEMKAGTLYPLLHLLEKNRYVESYDGDGDNGKVRKYYRLTRTGQQFLTQRRAEWETYARAVNGVLGRNGNAGI